jgi:hypothetical protein
MKSFRKNRNPHKCPNFVFEVRFNDWDDQEKAQYLAVRNTKRVEAVEVVKEDRAFNKMGMVASSLGRLLLYMREVYDVKNKELCVIAGMTEPTLIRYIKMGMREAENINLRAKNLKELQRIA